MKFARCAQPPGPAASELTAWRFQSYRSRLAPITVNAANTGPATTPHAVFAPTAIRTTRRSGGQGQADRPLDTCEGYPSPRPSRLRVRDQQRCPAFAIVGARPVGTIALPECDRDAVGDEVVIEIVANRLRASRAPKLEATCRR